MIAGIYTRVSTSTQASEGFSIQAQEKELKAYAKKYDIEVYKVYTDAGKSGSNTDRPAFQEMLSDAENGLFDIILIYKFDRLSRNLIDQELTIRQLKKVGVEVNSITEESDTLIRQIRGAVSEDEVRKIVERSGMVKLSRAKDGYHMGQSPFGYSIGEDKILYPNEDAFKVKLIFDEFAKPKDEKNISKLIKEIGISRQTAYNIIKNPIYRGFIVFRGFQYEGKHKPIMDD